MGKRLSYMLLQSSLACPSCDRWVLECKWADSVIHACPRSSISNCLLRHVQAVKWRRLGRIELLPLSRALSLKLKHRTTDDQFGFRGVEPPSFWLKISRLERVCVRLNKTLYCTFSFVLHRRWSWLAVVTAHCQLRPKMWMFYTHEWTWNSRSPSQYMQQQLKSTLFWHAHTIWHQCRHSDCD